MRRRLKALLSDGFWLYLFPAASILMPWPWYFALCKRMVKARHPYRQAIESELQYARTLLPDLDSERFRIELALTKFVDAADFYLNLARTHRWFRRHVKVQGRWPDAGQPTLLLGSHWGAAHWIWRDLHRHGIKAWFLARRGEAADFGRGRLARWYASFRGWGLHRAGCAGVVTTGGARRKIDALMTSAQTVVVLNDVPAGAGHSFVQASLLGKPVRFPAAAVQTALEHDAAIAQFAMSLDSATGRRYLLIELPHDTATATTVLQCYAGLLDPCLRQSPGQWQTWTLAPQLFAEDTQ